MSEMTNTAMLSLKDVYTLLGLEGHKPSRFPPCMMWMAKNLHEKSYLKYDARFQLTSFFKSVGAPWEVADKFLRDEFSRHGVSNHDFDKSYK